MHVAGFNSEMLNGVYAIVETKQLQFNESQSIFKKDDLRLVLWYNYKKEMYGRRISTVNPQEVHSFYDAKKGWSDKGTWLQINITPQQ